MSKKTIAKSMLRELQWVNLSETKKDFLEKICNKIINDELVEVVRCRDCKHRAEDWQKGISQNSMYCELDTGDPYELGRNADRDDWFCADGERMEE